MKILGSDEPRDQWEVSAGSSLGRCLIGHRVGEIVYLREGPLDELRYEILEIQSILVRAFQESLEHFGTLFPEDLALRKAEVRDGDVSSVLMMVAQSGIRAQELLSVYDTGYLTLEGLANLIGHHRYDVQRGLYTGEEHRLLCSIGSQEAQQEENLWARQATTVTMDLSTLITLQQLGLLGKLSERFQTIFVPQQLLSELVLEMTERKSWKSKAKHTIGFRDGHWEFVDIPQDMIEDDMKRLNELLSFVRDHCHSVPVAIEHAGLMTDSMGRARLVGATSLATLLVAQQQRIPLLADDLVLRSLGRGEYGCKGFWTLPLLSDLAERKFITSEEYRDACIRLIRTNHRYVPVTSEILLRAIRSSQSTDRDTYKVIHVLAGPDTTDSSAIPIAAEVLKVVYLDPALNERRSFILGAMLASLIEGRMADKVIELLLRRLTRIMHLEPLHLALARGDIEAWHRVVAPTLAPRSIGGLR